LLLFRSRAFLLEGSAAYGITRTPLLRIALMFPTDIKQHASSVWNAYGQFIKIGRQRLNVELHDE